MEKCDFQVGSPAVLAASGSENQGRRRRYKKDCPVFAGRSLPSNPPLVAELFSMVLRLVCRWRRATAFSGFLYGKTVFTFAVTNPGTSPLSFLVRVASFLPEEGE